MTFTKRMYTGYHDPLISNTIPFPLTALQDLTKSQWVFGRDEWNFKLNQHNYLPHDICISS